MEQLAPRYTDLSQADYLRAMAAIGLKASDIFEGRQPGIVNTGNSFLVVALYVRTRLFNAATFAKCDFRETSQGKRSDLKPHARWDGNRQRGQADRLLMCVLCFS